MDIRQQVFELANELDEEIPILDDFDEAILGYTYSFHGTYNVVLIYDMDKILDILINNHDMSPEDALEFYEFNIASLPYFIFLNHIGGSDYA